MKLVKLHGIIVILAMGAAALLLAAACKGSLLDSPVGSVDSCALKAEPSVVSARTGATLSFTTTADARCQVEFGTASASYAEASALESSPAASHVVTIASLADATRYYYRVRMRDSGGNDSLSPEYTLATSGLVGPEPTLQKKLRGVWLVGGVSGANTGSPIQQVDLYDPVTNAFYANVTSLPTPVSFMGAASIQMSESDHRIYVFGGFDTAGNSQSRIQYYSIENNAWTTDTTSMTGTPRANINVQRLYDRFYIVGGTQANAGSAWDGKATTYSYIPSTGSWNQLSILVPAASSERLCYAYGDVVYYSGGRITNATTNTALNEGFSVSQVATTTATEIGMISARTGAAGALWVPTSPSIAPRIITAGGFIATITGTTGAFIGQGTTAAPVLTTSQVSYLVYPFTGPPAAWQPTSSAWTASNVGFAAAAVANNGVSDVFLVFGGTGSVLSSGAIGTATVNRLVLVAAMNYTWNYNDANTATITMPAMPVARWGHAAVTIQNE